MKTGRRRGLAAFLALWLLALTGCGAPAVGPAPTARPAASAPPTAAPTAAPLTAADLTLAEKVGQLFLVRPDALDPARTPQQIEDPDAAGATALTDAMRATLARIPVGGVVLFLLWRLSRGRHVGEQLCLVAMLFYLLMENKIFLLSANPLFLLLPCALLTPRGAPLPVLCRPAETPAEKTPAMV